MAPVAKHGSFVFLIFGRFGRVLLSGRIMYPAGNDRVLYEVFGKIKFRPVVVM